MAIYILLCGSSYLGVSDCHFKVVVFFVLRFFSLEGVHIASESLVVVVGGELLEMATRWNVVQRLSGVC